MFQTVFHLPRNIEGFGCHAAGVGREKGTRIFDRGSRRSLLVNPVDEAFFFQFHDDTVVDNFTELERRAGFARQRLFESPFLPWSPAALVRYQQKTNGAEFSPFENSQNVKMKGFGGVHHSLCENFHASRIGGEAKSGRGKVNSISY